MKYLARLVCWISLVALACLWFTDLKPPAARAGSATDADVQQIEAWLQRYCATIISGDLEGYRAFWTEDVVWLPPNVPAREGIEACMEFNRPLFERYQSVETMTAKEIQVAGTWAYARVEYTYQGTPKPGAGVEPREEKGKGIFLLRRRPDGSWVSTHCVWNSNLPLAQTARPPIEVGNR